MHMEDIKYRVWYSRFTGGYVYSDQMGLVRFFSLVSSLVADEGLLEPEQYTGLKDKNGVEIYEGDVLGLTVNLIERGAIFIVKSYDVSCSRCYSISGFHLVAIKSHRELAGVTICPQMCHVIGNIHENPELLNEEVKQ